MTAKHNHPLYDILAKLNSAKMHYNLDKQRPRAVLICITVPGERIEIEVFDDGSVETSRFSGDESVTMGMDVIDSILKLYRE